jgi:hypothetical protein
MGLPLVNGGSHRDDDHEQRIKASDPVYEQGLWEGLIEVGLGWLSLLVIACHSCSVLL